MVNRIEPDKGEPDKERFLSALRGDLPDRVPNFEIVIEDMHVSRLLGREAGNTAYVAVSPDAARPMHPADYIELCRIIGQYMIAVENYWTPLKHMRPDGSVARIMDCSVKTRADMERIIWPSEEEIEERMQYVRECVNAAQGTGIGVVFSGACIFTALCECVIGVEDCLCMIYEDRDLFDVREHMAVMKPGGRWIAGSSHSVMDIIPHENFVAMINAIHGYGSYSVRS